MGLAFNGINIATGEYLNEAPQPWSVAAAALGERVDTQHLAALKARQQRADGSFLGLTTRADPDRLEESGWGVIFARELAENLQNLRKALKPLLDHRRSQAGGLFKEYSEHGAPLLDGPTPESAVEFAARHGQGPGPVDPTKIPYYLLIVGSPEQIPYLFQYQLGTQFAVGRVFFGKADGELDLEAFRRYVATVVDAETTKLRLPRRATFFGVHNKGDVATRLSHDLLVKPLADELTAAWHGWEVRQILETEATKASLTGLFSEPERPALLFAASHGAGFPATSAEDQARQLELQGALICQDWPGYKLWGKQPLLEEHYFAARDLTDVARPAGMIAFFFACYGAGTPRAADFAHEAPTEKPSAPSDVAFVARLPQRLLGHQEGGALAVIGQVERAWSFSFRWGRAGGQTTVFGDALDQLRRGRRVGYAMEGFSTRYQQLSVALSELRDQYKGGAGMQSGGDLDPKKLAHIWTAVNDARSYAIVGDPAVRLPLAAGD